MKIINIVIHPNEIRRILSRIGWPTEAAEFDLPYNNADWNVSQLVTETVDGFPVMEYDYSEASPDPPHPNLPQWENDIDPPHWEDPNYIIYDYP